MGIAGQLDGCKDERRKFQREVRRAMRDVRAVLRGVSVGGGKDMAKNSETPGEVEKKRGHGGSGVPPWPQEKGIQIGSTMVATGRMMFPESRPSRRDTRARAKIRLSAEKRVVEVSAAGGVGGVPVTPATLPA
jgi:hypothetical protein